MDKAAVRRWVNLLVANGLRNKAPHVTTGMIGGSAKQGDVTKVRAAMLEMAEKLDPQQTKRERKREAEEPGPPGPGKGQDDLPEVREAGGQQGGEGDAAVGPDEPEAGGR